MNSIMFYALLLLVALAPLPLGSNREWSWTLCALVTGLIALAWALQGIIRPRQVSRALDCGLIALFLAVCAWAALQTLARLPVAWHHPLWGMASQALGLELPGSTSLAAADTFTALLRLLCYGLVFFLSFQFCRDRDRALMVFRWLAGAGLVYSVYGLVVFWGELDSLIWLFEMDFVNAVRGTFVNRNHFATWLGLCLLCSLALLHRRVVIRRNPAYELPVDQGLRVEQFVLQTWKPLVVLIIMSAALILTHSRAGFLSTLAGVGVLLLAMNRRERFRSVRARAALASVLAVSLLVFWITSEVLVQRMDRLGADAQTRLQAYQLTRDGIADNPLLGFGYGTFADSFRLYRDESVSGFLDKTHNTYLENIFELGWPAALALFACFGWLALTCARGVRERGRDWVFPATGLAATAMVGLHALFDFSLQMSATAMAYALLMGAACAQSYPSR